MEASGAQGDGLSSLLFMTAAQYDNYSLPNFPREDVMPLSAAYGPARPDPGPLRGGEVDGVDPVFGAEFASAPAPQRQREILRSALRQGPTRRTVSGRSW